MLKKWIRQTGKLLSKKHKKQLTGLFFVMLIGALLEAVGVSAIVPFVTVVTREDFVESSPFIKSIYDSLGFRSQSDFTLACIGILIAIFIIKALYLLFERYVQASYVKECKIETQRRLADTLFQKPYAYFLNRNSSELHRILVADLKKVFQILQDNLAAFTDVVVSVILMLTLFIINPLMVLCVAVIISLVILLTGAYVRPRLHKVGDIVLFNERKRSRWISQGFAGIKEVKHTGAEAYISDRISAYEEVIGEGEKTQKILSSIPRIITETACICGMLGALAVLIAFGRSPSTLLSELSAFAVAAIKLIPCANKVSYAMAAIVYNMPALDGIVAVLDEEEEKKESEKKETREIEEGYDVIFNDVSFSYPGSERMILNDVSFKIRHGEMSGIIGASGAGKTTLVDLIMRLIGPDKGEIIVNSDKIGYIPQNVFLLDDSLRANVAFGVKEEDIDDTKVTACLREAQLGDYLDSLPEGLNSGVGERGMRISGGQAQRIGIARALYRDPDILILDEATSALDIDTEAAILKEMALMHGKRTIIVVAHRSAALSDCDVIYKVDDTKLIKKTKEDS